MIAKSEPLFKIEQSEAQFQSAVMQLATTLGWDWLHIRPGLTNRGRYLTQVSGTLGSGWPDLVLVKVLIDETGAQVGSRTLFVELKAEKGRLTANQVRVLNLLEAAGHAVFCWRPSDWDALLEVLSS